MSDPAATTNLGRLTLLEHLNLKVAITEEQIKLLANDLDKQEQEGEPCEDLRIQLAEKEKKGKDLNLRIVKCSQSPLPATTQDMVIDLCAAPFVNPPTDKGVSGWDEMLALKRQDKAISLPIRPVFPLNVRKLHMRQGNHSLNSGTIGSMGADSKQAETWT